MAVNYDDERFNQVTQEQNQAIQNLQNSYNQMITQADEIYNKQAQAAEEYGRTQQQLQQQNTDFAIEQIEQQKDQAQKDYIKEQKGAYVDWQKQSNKYGVNAEAQAQQGMLGTGYYASLENDIYGQYQNRIIAAKDSYDRAVLNYNNAMKDARLTNNVKQAEIAYQALQLSLEKSLAGFQYKNQLIVNQIDAVNAERDRGYSKWRDVLSQINYENEKAEEQRRYETELAEQQRQFNEQMAYQNRKIASDNALQSQYMDLYQQQEQNNIQKGDKKTINGVEYKFTGDTTEEGYLIWKNNGVEYYEKDGQMYPLSKNTNSNVKDKGSSGGNPNSNNSILNAIEGIVSGAVDKNKVTTSSGVESKSILKRKLKQLPKEYKIVGGKQYPVYQDKRNNQKYYLKNGEYIKIK